MRYCGFVMIHFVELDHSEQSDQQDQSGYTSASSDRFRSCFAQFPELDFVRGGASNCVGSDVQQQHQDLRSS